MGLRVPAVDHPQHGTANVRVPMIGHREIVRVRGLCPVGSRVRSRFRARWTGTVLELVARDDTYDLAMVRIELDRKGNPIRKPWTKILSAYWLEPA